MQKLKLCFIIPRAYEYFFPGMKPQGGGAEKQCYLFANEIATYDDIELHFCLADFGQKEHQKIHRIIFWKIHKLSDNKFVAIKKIIRLIQKIQADVYIFRSANPAIFPLSFYIKSILKKKVLYMMSSDSEIDFKSMRKKSGFLTAFSMKITHKYVDLLSTQNQLQYEKLKEQRRNRKTTIIPNVINNLKTGVSNDKESDTILWVGRLVPVKQAEIFFELAQKFPDIYFTMIAPDVPEYKNYGQKLQKEISEISNISYIEYLEPVKLNKLYQQAKIYIITSEKEGFSNTMMEAMAAKCAVLSLNVNPNNIFINQENGLFANGDKELFFQLLKKLVNDKELAENLGINAQKYIFKNHDVVKISRQFIAAVKQSFS